ncbi:MAG: hypothetical protein Q6373_003005, partial [Candidatus Sigynarchaeota archaeon]
EYTPASQGPVGEKGTRSRLRLTLDDGTGLMVATWFGVGEAEASRYEKGDMVIALARAGEYKNEITFTIDGIRKLNDLSVELHHRAMILKKLKQLAANKKPLELPGGGRIINPADDASKFFSSTEKGTEQDDVSEIEQPIMVGDASTQNIQFTPRLGIEKSEGDGDGIAAGSAAILRAESSGAGAVPEEDVEIEDDIIKGSIMNTITEPEFLDGITIAKLAEILALDRNIIARVLKIMANEGTIEEIPSKPGTYRGK